MPHHPRLGELRRAILPRKITEGDGMFTLIGTHLRIDHPIVVFGRRPETPDARLGFVDGHVKSPGKMGVEESFGGDETGGAAAWGRISVSQRGWG
jgi:hypothetical protein